MKQVDAGISPRRSILRASPGGRSSTLTKPTNFDFGNYPMTPWINDKDNFPIGIRNDKTQYFVKFTEEYQDFKKWLTRKKFNIWVQKFATFKKLEYTEGNTNGMRWFMLGNEIEDDNDIMF
jgi:hypothetical protein